ncbi:hypothetical protein EIP91_005207 [Steccherinum ochraceum]|uniref:Uncharacterized protein n=1 Tax=Steccherinum ochraceum TaxID=92696 RepID=A0A4R0RFW1_9APHY|nr:hypothetical protein EIP91_005207 [Steccherinum ochraceum]
MSSAQPTTSSAQSCEAALQAFASWRPSRQPQHHHHDGPHRDTSHEEAALLNAAGQYWSSRQELLRRKNYVLRPKFLSERKVMWKKSSLDAFSVRFLDFRNYSTDIKRMVDAYCPITQRLVCIRRTRTGSDELQTLLRLSKFKVSWSPCPPVLDMFEDDQDCSVTFVVMPYCRIRRTRLSPNGLWPGYR